MQKGATGRAWAILAAGAAIQIFTGVPAAWGCLLYTSMQLQNLKMVMFTTTMF